MSLDKIHRYKGPFATLSYPKSFYHPTPAKDVDANVAIKSPNRKDLPAKNFEFTKLLEAGTELQTLPRLTDASPKFISSQDHVTASIDSFGDTSSKFEHQNSTLLNDTQLTSSVDEKRNDLARKDLDSLSKGYTLENSVQDGSTSVLKNYIDRFRYSAPKSREERRRENSNKSPPFWWLKSEEPNQQPAKPKEKISHIEGVPERHEKNRIRLTKEAVLELDKETSELQNKADTLLSRSQLSLVSSGPCVSTNGLGSSSVISECSSKSDKQPTYRPIFINTQSECHPSAPQIGHDNPPGPQDVLTRWRMRRNMEQAYKKSTPTPVPANHQSSQQSEIDVRLEDFRKKLFAQRALITKEEIQFERKKMNLLLDEKDDSPTKENESKEAQGNKNLEESQMEDPILARIRKTTRSSGFSSNGKLSALSMIQSTSEVDDRHSCKGNSDSNTVNELPLEEKDDHSDELECRKEVLSSKVVQGGNSFDSRSNNCTRNEREALGVHNDTNDSSSLREGKGTAGKGFNLPRQHLHNVEEDRNSNNVIEFESCKADKRNMDFDTPPNSLYHQRLQAEKPCVDTSCSHKSKLSAHEKIVTCDEGVHYEAESAKSSENWKSEYSSDSSQKNKPYSVKMRKKNKHKVTNKTIQSVNETVSDLSSKTTGDSNEFIEYSSDNENQAKENCNVVHKRKPVREMSLTLNNQRKPVIDIKDEKKLSPPLPKGSPQSRIKEVIGETIVDHLFDRPSMISSADSWASLFPQSPTHSQSAINSILATPTKSIDPCEPATGTPSHGLDPNAQEDSSDEDFAYDPLMKLLLQQRDEYLLKLELIESKLQVLEKS